MFVNQIHRGRQLFNHPRMIYDKSCKITDFKGNWLKRLMVYVHANGVFRETMSHAVIEAMATGLPVVYLKEPAVNEVCGNAGIGVGNNQDLKKMVIKLLEDEGMRRTYSKLSKERARMFDIHKTITGFDKLIKECVGG
jgi:glycosyltransferase involved in cell wall biosynthesis